MNQLVNIVLFCLIICVENVYSQPGASVKFNPALANLQCSHPPQQFTTTLRVTVGINTDVDVYRMDENCNPQYQQSVILSSGNQIRITTSIFQRFFAVRRDNGALVSTVGTGASAGQEVAFDLNQADQERVPPSDMSRNFSGGSSSTTPPPPPPPPSPPPPQAADNANSGGSDSTGEGPSNPPPAPLAGSSDVGSSESAGDGSNPPPPGTPGTPGGPPPQVPQGITADGDVPASSAGQQPRSNRNGDSGKGDKNGSPGGGSSGQSVRGSDPVVLAGIIGGSVVAVVCAIASVYLVKSSHRKKAKVAGNKINNNLLNPRLDRSLSNSSHDGCSRDSNIFIGNQVPNSNAESNHYHQHPPRYVPALPAHRPLSFCQSSISGRGSSLNMTITKEFLESPKPAMQSQLYDARVLYDTSSPSPSHLFQKESRLFSSRMADNNLEDPQWNWSSNGSILTETTTTGESEFSSASKQSGTSEISSPPHVPLPIVPPPRTTPVRSSSKLRGDLNLEWDRGLDDIGTISSGSTGESTAYYNV